MSTEETVFSRRTHRDIDEALAWLDEMGDVRPQRGGRNGRDLPTWLRNDLRLEAPPAPSISPPPNDDNLSWLDTLVSGLGPSIEETPTTSWEETDVFARRASAARDNRPAGAAAVAPGPDRPGDDDNADRTLSGLEATPTAKVADALPPSAKSHLDAPTVVSEMPLSQHLTAGSLDLDAELEALLSEATVGRTPRVPPPDDDEALNPSAIPDDPDKAIAWLENMSRRARQRGMAGSAFGRRFGTADETEADEPAVILEPPPFDEPLADNDEVGRALRDLGAEMGVEPPAEGAVTVPPRARPQSAIGKAGGQIEEYLRDLEAEVAAEPPTAAAPTEPPANEGSVPPPVAKARLPEDVSEAVAWLEQLVSGSGVPLEDTTLELGEVDVNALMAEAAPDQTPAAAALPGHNDEADAAENEPTVVQHSVSRSGAPGADEEYRVTARAPEVEATEAGEKSEADKLRAERDAVIAELMGYEDEELDALDAALADKESGIVTGAGAEQRRANGINRTGLDEPEANEPTVAESEYPAGAERFIELVDVDPAGEEPTYLTGTAAGALDAEERQPTTVLPPAPPVAAASAAASEADAPPTFVELPPAAEPPAAHDQAGDEEHQPTLIVAGGAEAHPPAEITAAQEPSADEEHQPTAYISGAVAARVPADDAAAAEGDGEQREPTLLVTQAAPPVKMPLPAPLPTLGAAEDLSDALDWLERFAAETEGSSIIQTQTADGADAQVAVGLHDAPFAEARGRALAAVDDGNYREAADYFAYVLASNHDTAADAVVSDMLRLLGQINDQPLLYRVLGDAYGKQQLYQQASEAYRRGLEML